MPDNSKFNLVGIGGGVIAIFLFWFTASRSNRHLLNYLTERETLAKATKLRATKDHHGHEWYNDTRLFFYVLVTISSVSYMTSTLIWVLAPVGSVIRKNNVESDVMSLVNITSFLSAVSVIIWTILHGVMLEWQREHQGGGVTNVIATGRGDVISGTRQSINGGRGGGGGGGTNTSASERGNGGGGGDRYEANRDGYESSYRGSSQGGHMDDMYTADYYPEDDNLAIGGTPQRFGESHSDSQPRLAGQLASGNVSGTHISSFNQNYGSAQGFDATTSGRGSALPHEINRSQQQLTDATNNNNHDNSSEGCYDCFNTFCSEVFPYRLPLSVLVVIIYYIVITAMTEEDMIKGSNFSAGLSFFLGLICGILAVAATWFLLLRGATIAARRFGLALSVLFFCLIGRGIAVLSFVQEATPPEVMPAVIPLIDALCLTFVIVILPSQKFCLCFDVDE